MSPNTSPKRPRCHSLRSSLSSIGDILCRSTQQANNDARIMAGLGTSMKRVPDDEPEGDRPRSFTVFRTRMYTKDKDDWDSFRYTEVRVPGPTPQIKISPPDDEPFKMTIEEEETEKMDYTSHSNEEATNSPPPTLPCRSPLRLKLDTRILIEKPLPPLPHPPGEDWPPSPPMTPSSEEGDIIIEIEEMDIEAPPRRIPPPPPPPRRKRAVQLPPSPPMTPETPITSSLTDISMPPTRLPPPPPSRKPTPPPRTHNLLSLPPSILLQIFVHLNHPKQMLDLSFVHPHLYTLFEVNSLPIFQQSLRLYSPMTHQLVSLQAADEENYFATYLSCTETIDTLKASIRRNCRFFLSPELLSPASEEEEEAFTEALAAIWCFTILFSSTARELAPQLSWLRKHNFGKQDLKRLQEVYNCLYVLLRPLTTSVTMATEVGVVRDRDIDHKWVAVEEVERWGWWVLSRGLDVVEKVVEVDDDEEERWDIVVEEGLDEWDSEDGGREAAFLREAIGKMYRERCEEEGFVGLFGMAGPWGPTSERL